MSMLDVFVADGKIAEDPLWLNDHPPWREELLRRCLEEFTDPGDLVLDPFARHSALLHLATRQGRRVLASNYDPICLLQLRLSASPPDPRRLDAVFSRLADSSRQGQRFSQYINNLYTVLCRTCSEPVPAQYLIWDSEQPVEKNYTCPNCGQPEHAPVTPQDLTLHATIEAQGLAYWQVRQRLVDSDDSVDVQTRAASLLDLYTPRNRKALGELILQAEQLFEDDDVGLDIIRGLCLACLQRCHSLTRSATEARLPSSLRRPARFVEHNVWHVFQESYRKLRCQSSSTPVGWASGSSELLAPQQESSPGSALALHLTIRELVSALRDHPRVPFICTDPTRADLTATTLTFLWAAWLFGREAAGSLRSLSLHSPRDWDWYSRAMATVFRLLETLLADDGRMLLAFTADDSRMLPSLMLATSRSGLVLEQTVQQHQGFIRNRGRFAYRLLFRRPHRPVHPLPREAEVEPPSPEQLAADLHEEGLEATKLALSARAEPVEATWLHLPILARWSTEELLSVVPTLGDHPQRYLLTWLLLQIETLLPATGFPLSGLSRWPSVGAIDSGQKQPVHWWLTEQADEPLSERLESATLQALHSTLTWPEQALYEELCRLYSGLLTPDRELIDACVLSYGTELSTGYWQLRAEDWPEARAESSRQTLLHLAELGQRLDYRLWIAPRQQKDLMDMLPDMAQSRRLERAYRPNWEACDLVWQEEGDPVVGFALSDSAALSPWLLPPDPTLASVSRYVILPGGRSNLLAYKLTAWPDLRRHLAAAGWTLVKQRQVRKLAVLDGLDRAGWRARIGLDPIADLVDDQLRLF